MNRKLLDRLEFHDDLVLHHEVQTVSAVKERAFVRNRDGALALESNSCERQLMANARFIGGLKKARPQRLMHFDARTDDLTRQIAVSRSVNHSPP